MSDYVIVSAESMSLKTALAELARQVNERMERDPAYQPLGYPQVKNDGVRFICFQAMLR